MKTDEFISLLATGVAPVDRHVQRKCFSRAITVGAIGALLLMIIVFGIRPDIREMLVTPLFWFKISFPFTLAIASLLLLIRLSRPDTRNISTRLWLAPAGPILVIWIAALAALALAPPAERLNLIMGFSWRTCPFNIAFLSIPMCVTITWAVRQLAPTRLRAAGAVAGLLAGSVATVAYCLHCPEMGIPFWGIWYLMGMLIPAVLGLIFGPSLLRW